MIRRYRLELLVSIGLGVACFVLYLTIAQAYRSVPGYSTYLNTFFGADHSEAVQGWVTKHKGVHPLVLLLVVPLGELTELLFGSYETGVVVSAAGFGAVAVVLLYWVIRMLIGRPLVAAVIAAFYGLSMTQLVFACLPDTYVISTISLMPTYLLTLWSLRERRFSHRLWILAGVLAFAITITNVVQTVICLVIVLLVSRPRGERLQPLLRIGAAIGLIVVPLSLLQAWLIPGAKIFFMPAVYDKEMNYVTPLLIDKPLRVVKEIFRSFLVYPWVGQFPRVTQHDPGEQVKIVYYKSKLDFGWLAASTALLWGALWFRGLWHSVRDERTRLFTLCAGLTVLFNIAMHTVYGTREMFLYTPHFIFALLWLALSPRAFERRWVVAAWTVLALLAGWNNLGVIREIIGTFGA